MRPSSPRLPAEIDDYLTVLQFLGKSPGYPLFNNWLIYLQTSHGPRPQSWATPAQWEGLGRRVLRTARPMLVLNPYLGPVEVVHDVADTAEHLGAVDAPAGFPRQFEPRDAGHAGWLVDRAVIEAVLPPVTAKPSPAELDGSAPAFLTYARVVADRLLGHTRFAAAAPAELFLDRSEDPPLGLCRGVRPEIEFTTRDAPNGGLAAQMELESVVFLLSERIGDRGAAGALHRIAANLGAGFEQVRLEMVVRVAARLERWSSESPESLRRRRIRA